MTEGNNDGFRLEVELCHGDNKKKTTYEEVIQEEKRGNNTFVLSEQEDETETYYDSYFGLEYDNNAYVLGEMETAYHYKKIDYIKFWAQDWIYNLEVFQIIGILGVLLLFWGSFYPMVTIEIFNNRDRIDYDQVNMLLYSMTALGLIFLNQHKFCLIPALLSIAENISVNLGFLATGDYVEYRSGYYLVWIGSSAIIISTFLINNGYARGSGFFKNKPIYFRDMLWICVVVAILFVLAGLSSETGNLAKYNHQIQELKDAGYELQGVNEKGSCQMGYRNGRFGQEIE